MSVQQISAGEAYVSITCDNSALVGGLQEAALKIQSAVQKMAAAKDSLTAKVGIEGVERIEKGLSRVQTAIAATKSKALAMGAELSIIGDTAFRAVGSALKSAFSALGETGDSFDKMSQRVGIGTEALSEYAYAVGLCGADILNVEGALKAMSTKLTDAFGGASSAVDDIESLGFTIDSLKDKTPEEQFEALADAIASIADPTMQAGAAMKIFGDDRERFRRPR